MRRPVLYQTRSNSPSVFAWNDFDQLFDNFFTPRSTETSLSSFLATETEETESHYRLKFDVPGVKKEDMKIELQNGVLSLSGERKQESPAEGSRTGLRERIYGSFTRSFSLPEGVDAEGIEAKYQDGVLEVSIPKAAQAKAKAITIN